MKIIKHFIAIGALSLMACCMADISDNTQRDDDARTRPQTQLVADLRPHTAHPPVQHIVNIDFGGRVITFMIVTTGNEGLNPQIIEDVRQRFLSVMQQSSMVRRACPWGS